MNYATFRQVSLRGSPHSLGFVFRSARSSTARRPKSLKLRILSCVLLVVRSWAASDQVAGRLAHQAHEALDSGQVVQAYLLYAEAAAREPQNSSYRANRDALAAAAKLLTKANIQNADVAHDIEAAEKEPPGTEPPVEFATQRDWERDKTLQPLPHLQSSSSLGTFETQGDEKSLFQQVAAAYGIRPVFDPELDVHPNIRFAINQADFRTAMEGLTAVTQTFIFPISQHDIFVARNTLAKRSALEPHVLLTFPLPNALEQKDLIEAANATRALLSIRSIGWDTANRMVLIRDRYTSARIARSVLEALLLPRAQVSLEVQFLTFDSEVSYHYGVSLQTAYQLVNFGSVGGFKTVLPKMLNATTFATFGGGATLYGIGLTEARVFANYSNSFSRVLFDATVAVSDGQIANFHVGDKYPIAQSLYTGFGQSNASIYNPSPQITMEDLGLILKLTPHVNGEGSISMDVEADFRTLSSQTFNTIPAIDQRAFKGNVSMREGEWAVLAGMEATTHSRTRNGLAGISQIPGVGQILSDNTRDTENSQTLIVIKPTITRLPVSASLSPQYLLGPLRGERVLL
jgi:general secretion pathway protein D